MKLKKHKNLLREFLKTVKIKKKYKLRQKKIPKVLNDNWLSERRDFPTLVV